MRQQTLPEFYMRANLFVSVKSLFWKKCPCYFKKHTIWHIKNANVNKTQPISTKQSVYQKNTSCLMIGVSNCRTLQTMKVHTLLYLHLLWRHSGRVEIQIYSFFNLCARRREWVVKATVQPLYPSANRPGAHYIGGWVGPRDSLDGSGNFAPTRIRSPDRSFAVPTELSRPYKLLQKFYTCHLKFSLFVGQKGWFLRRCLATRAVVVTRASTDRRDAVTIDWHCRWRSIHKNISAAGCTGPP
jgi:hypothetical protein